MDAVQRKKTPLSDYLHQLLGQWSRDYLLSDKEYDGLFAGFEILAGLAYLTVNESKEQLVAARNRKPNNFCWLPVGRASWDTQVRDAAISDLTSLEQRGELLKVGFAQSDNGYLDLAIANIRELMEQVSYR
jgi:hypothetical protein